MTGSLALILHAHLPFVHHPEHEFFHEESWLFEAITESYIPLLGVMQSLLAEGVPVRIAMSLTPTLCAMLDDALLRERYVRHLDLLIALADREWRRNRSDASLRSLAEFYHEFFNETRRIFVEDWNCDLLAIVRQLRDAGALDVIASAATHAILPILQATPSAVHAQIAIGCDNFRETFGGEPRGFWLPECAYAAGIDHLLCARNIRWFVVDAHSLLRAQPPAKRGNFAPCFTPAGPGAFARDLTASKQVWSAESGYPGSPVYRDFYRDIGFDLTTDELQPLPNAKGTFTGIKYYRITGRDTRKEFYDRPAAKETARKHAQHFVEQCTEQLRNLPTDGWNPILVVPFDAELFGHWWFEGPIFFEEVIRAAATKGLRLISPTEFLEQNPTQQIVQPAASSWGDKGFLDVWLNEKCGWIYPHLHAANRRMIGLAKSNTQKVSAGDERVLRQLARELLLAQASDWPFMIRNGTARDYAMKRVTDHLSRFQKLADQFEKKNVDRDFLAQCQERDNLFPNMDWRHFA